MLQNYNVFLFDLDGTLLFLDFDRFLQSYYALLVRKVSHIIPAHEFLNGLERGVQAMLENEGTKTNKEAFFEAFTRACCCACYDFTEILEDFYENDFGLLKPLSKKVPLVNECLYLLKEQGKKVVLATNPIFPRRAVEHRMEWAGIKDFPFELITTYENMHSCKPARKYFEEVLKKVSATPEESVMIGDDFGLDSGSVEAGIDFWMVENGMNKNYFLTDRCTWKGTFEKFAAEVFYSFKKDNCQ